MGYQEFLKGNNNRRWGEGLTSQVNCLKSHSILSFPPETVSDIIKQLMNVYVISPPHTYYDQNLKLYSAILRKENRNAD